MSNQIKEAAEKQKSNLVDLFDSHCSDCREDDYGDIVYKFTQKELFELANALSHPVEKEESEEEKHINQAVASTIIFGALLDANVSDEKIHQLTDTIIESLSKQGFKLTKEI